MTLRKINIHEEDLTSVIRQLRARPPIIRLLTFVGYAGIAKLDQCDRFLSTDPDLSKQLERQEMIDLVCTALSNQWLMEIKSDFDARGQIILYLTVKGHEKLAAYSHRLGAESIYGMPNENRIKHLEHDLVIAESCVYWNRLSLIVSFTNESELRAENKRLWWKVKNDWRYQKVEENDSLPDYKIQMVYRDGLQPASNNCEAVVKYSRAKIEQKLKSMIWFAKDSYQADKVKALTGALSIVADPWSDPPAADIVSAVTKVLYPRQTQFKDDLSFIESRILKVLGKTRMALSGRDLSLFIDADSQALRRARHKLLANGLIRSKPGSQTTVTGGRPCDFFYLPKNEKLFEMPGFERHIMLTKTLYHAVKGGSKFDSYDPEIPSLIIKSGTMRQQCVSDDAGESVEIMTDWFISFRDICPNRLSLVVIDGRRFAEFENYLDRAELLQLCDYKFLP